MASDFADKLIAVVVPIRSPPLVFFAPSRRAEAEVTYAVAGANLADPADQRDSNAK